MANSSQTRVSDILPAPFEWIEFPTGQVTLGRGYDGNAHGVGQLFDIPSFSIAKYPITNAQFAKFIEAGGYENRHWWTDVGWQQREENSWAKPRYWDDPKWNGADYPVVGVSWYESVAFCLWLSEASEEQITLPTEQQWQHAAQGDDGRTYPWGDQFDRRHCNNDVDKKGSGKTTPVTHYEGKGDSAYGVVDMAGNVWEWCLTEYKTGLNDIETASGRVLRGGSWYGFGSVLFRNLFRLWFHPEYGSFVWGFRICRA